MWFIESKCDKQDTTTNSTSTSNNNNNSQQWQQRLDTVVPRQLRERSSAPNQKTHTHRREEWTRIRTHFKHSHWIIGIICKNISIECEPVWQGKIMRILLRLVCSIDICTESVIAHLICYRSREEDKGDGARPCVLVLRRQFLPYTYTINEWHMCECCFVVLLFCCFVVSGQMQCWLWGLQELEPSHLVNVSGPRLSVHIYRLRNRWLSNVIYRFSIFSFFLPIWLHWVVVAWAEDGAGGVVVPFLLLLLFPFPDAIRRFAVFYSIAAIWPVVVQCVCVLYVCVCV